MSTNIDQYHGNLQNFFGDLPSLLNYRYSDEVHNILTQRLFQACLDGRPDFATLLFPHGQPESGSHVIWSLREAQGAIEGAEYTEAARGQACGHIFRPGEASYQCRTCSSDPTCVLCARCFDASDHEGHQVYIHASDGNSGCCDCGDPEAWSRPVHCGIHSSHEEQTEKSRGKAKAISDVPDELAENIRRTIGYCFDYMCDVWSCSPEQLRANKTGNSVIYDKLHSQLDVEVYGVTDDAAQSGRATEYALVLWNDEKHTVQDVRDIVARACKMTRDNGSQKADEVDRIGRSIVQYSHDLPQLLKAATILEQPKLSVTIRSSRDIFRELMCGTIIKWILDIAGCAVGSDGKLLKAIICEELLREWHVGSLAHHKFVGQDGIYDHDREEVAKDLQEALGPYSTGLIQRLHEAWRNTNSTDQDDDDDEVDDQPLDDIDESMDLDEPIVAEYNAIDDTMNIDPSQPDPVDPHETPRQPHLLQQQHRHEIEPFDDASSSDAFLAIPRTPAARLKKIPKPPGYWRDVPDTSNQTPAVPEEDLRQRVRLDWLILYDLRMWKQLRVDLREVLITTLIGIPKFKRLLALRFASVFTVLAELHLIADREPEHSLIFLSLQLLTAPSITAEVVERGNFLTNLMAIIYTFLSTRQVGYPHQVDLSATLAIEQGVVFNRRAQTFYHDMRHMLSLEIVRERIRLEPRYLLQFLDIAKIHQGICPNTRATGEHVEYEMEAWMSLSTVMTEVMRLCRSFAESFHIQKPEHVPHLENAIRSAAAVAAIHSIGAERHRFENSEIKDELVMQALMPLEFERENSPIVFIPLYMVAEQAMSCYHPLHYMLAWLLTEYRDASAERIRQLFTFKEEDLVPFATSKQSAQEIKHCLRQSSATILVLFDYPIRVCAWMAQTRAGMWVRNGLSLRHQIQQYRSASRRELTYQRDIFLVQTAFVVCNPRDVLAQLIDRFDLQNWLRGHYEAKSGRDETQVIDVAEDLIHLLIVVLCDRLQLVVGDREKIAMEITKRELIHALCYKPLSYADLKKCLTEKVKEADDQGILQNMTTYKPPEGMTDHGTFTLKEDYFKDIDPYLPFLTRNQREEAETAYRKHVAKESGKDVSEIVYEPSIVPIETGMFKDIHLLTSTPLFAQMIFYFLQYIMMAPTLAPDVQTTKVEQLFQFVLHLILVAIQLDEHNPNRDLSQHSSDVTESNSGAQIQPELSSFCRMVMEKQATRVVSSDTIAGLLRRSMDLEHLKSSAVRVKHIFLKLQSKVPAEFNTWILTHSLPFENFDESSLSSDAAAKALKKRQALERQARVMEQFKMQQATFLENQDMDWDDKFNEFDDDDDDNMTATNNGKVAFFPSGSCILCQEETDEHKLYGTFGFITESKMFRSTPLDHPEWLGEVLEVPESLDEEYSDRPFGVASKNRRSLRKSTADGRVIELDRQDLAQGFPIGHANSGAVSTGCGHIMHHTCYEVYVAATARRHQTQIARHHPESIERSEFLCPLCKALGNTFLPIVWKPQPLTYPGILGNSRGVDALIQMLANDPPSIQANIYRQAATIMQVYAKQAFMPTLAAQVHTAQVNESSLQQQQLPPSLPGRLLSFDNHVQSFSALFRRSDTDGTSSATPAPSRQRGLSMSALSIKELRKAYDQLCEPLKWTVTDPLYQPARNFWRSYGVLISALGSSIKAVEVSQRGISSSGSSSFIEKISSQTTSHLRVLSETIMAYLSIHQLTGGLEGTTAEREYAERISRLLMSIYPSDPEKQITDPLIFLDPFTCLSELSFYTNKEQPMDFTALLRIFLMLEIVRVVLLCTFNQPSTNFATAVETSDPVDTIPEAFVILVDAILAQRPTVQRVSMTRLWTLVQKYALPFLRSSALLYHIRFGIEFPTHASDGAEFKRLADLLLIPDLPIIIEEAVQSTATMSMVQRWIQHAHANYENFEGLTRIRLGHPAIFELVGLPKNFDTLQDQVMRRKCPTTGRPLWDPAICLVCGEIFCSQSICCKKVEPVGVNGTISRKVGGCWQHRQKCSGRVGIFLHVRKCTVVYLHENSGSFTVAPYLDKFGEADPSLRSSLQLFLNQKRYDAIFRAAWLQHQIPSIIARRLEGEINTGGWESL